VNPLTSLCDKEVYSIPLLMMIGWRGKPGIKDAPQHRKMGKISLPLLDILEIPHAMLPSEKGDVSRVISYATNYIRQTNLPYALMVEKGTIDGFIFESPKRDYALSREEAVRTIVSHLDRDALIVSTTGKTSRELFEYRSKNVQQANDFYTVGSMGCCSSIALGIALQKPTRQVVALDGDGSVIMQMGALATIGHHKPRNLYHFLLDNGAYESTGAQPTVSPTVDFASVALGCGYASAIFAEDKNSLEQVLTNLKDLAAPVMVVVQTNQNSRKNLGRPTETPLQTKERFMQWAE